jgi:hypothetical protein
MKIGSNWERIESPPRTGSPRRCRAATGKELKGDKGVEYEVLESLLRQQLGKN